MLSFYNGEKQWVSDSDGLERMRPILRRLPETKQTWHAAELALLQIRLLARSAAISQELQPQFSHRATTGKPKMN